MLQLAFFEDEQKTHCFVCVPLNAYELLFLAQRAGPQEHACVCVSSLQTCTKMPETVLPFMFKPFMFMSRTMMERLKKKWQHDVSEWLVNEFMLLMWS